MTGFLAMLLLLGMPSGGGAELTELKLDDVNVPGLQQPVRIRRDAFDVPHILALDERDATFMLGWVHAQDRFFQMDLQRRTFSGRSAELLGAAALASDVQLRTLGVDRSAQTTLADLSPETVAWLEDYARGVNAFLAQSPVLPPEYAALELTIASVPPWSALDSVVVAKGFAFGMSFDLLELELTQAVLDAVVAGSTFGFDGTALVFEDLYRSAPFEPTLTIPQDDGAAAAVPRVGVSADKAAYLGPATARMVERFVTAAAAVPLLSAAVHAQERTGASNWMLVDGDHSESGDPLLASDPHLGLDQPTLFYQAHLYVETGSGPPTNLTGVGLTGTPALVSGCNPRICWASTNNPMDVTDVYQEVLVADPMSGLPTHTLFEGVPEPVVAIDQVFRVNEPGDGLDDSIETANVDPLAGGTTLVVPRRNQGPLVSLDMGNTPPVGLSVQYAGWGATHELESYRRVGRAQDLADFTEALQFFDVGSQNFAYADRTGNIAYFTSGELPIREDLQNLGQPDGGIPPFLIRDGTHTLQHEWLSVQNPQPQQSSGFEILPFAEMPQIVNPAAGVLLNANNDPLGITFDNDPLNQIREGGGLFYLNPGYATGLRAGRIQRLMEDALQGGGRISTDQLMQMQSNHQLLDAEVLTPYLLHAFDNADQPGSPLVLAPYAGDPAIVEAIGRLRAWDFSTPTGIAEGYDPGDDPDNLSMPSPTEIASSVAATIYSTWRGQVVSNVIDGTLDRIGLGQSAPGSELALSALRRLLDQFPAQMGVGASGIGFFHVPGVPVATEARDVILLDSLRSALELLASDAFAPAFGGSTQQQDYRWGKLHRIVFDHVLGGPFSIPAGDGFQHLAPDLPGLARSGGLGAVDASTHSARADGLNEFMFGAGASRRFVARLNATGHRPTSYSILPGGQSGVLGSRWRSDQLPLWLVHQTIRELHGPEELLGNSRTFQRFLPEPDPF